MHARSKRRTTLKRCKFWLLHRMERRRIFNEGFWDKCKIELIALGVYMVHKVNACMRGVSCNSTEPGKFAETWV